MLAIECDGATYHSSPSARDRDRLRQEQLQRQGWRFHRIWSSEWFSHKDASAQKAIDAYQEAVRRADQPSASQPAETTFQAPSVPPSPVPVAPPRRNDLYPALARGLPIGTYTDSQLRDLARWIRSDDVLRTEDELLDEMMHQLGFQRRGKNVVARLATAIARTRPTKSQDER